MNCICLGYFEEKKFDAMSESKLNAYSDECFAYDEVLRRSGHTAGGEAHKNSRKSVTLRWKNGKASVTDGPYAETKEQLGGFGVIEAKDPKRAIALISKHPAIKNGVFESRPVEDMAKMVSESERRA
jgi:hypothetical protein